MKRFFLHLLSVILLLAVSGLPLHAQERVYTGNIPDAGHTFAYPSAALEVKDQLYDDPDIRPLIGTVSKMVNVVKLEINEESPIFVPSDFTVSVPLQITKTPLSGGTPVVVNKTLVLSYRLGMGKKSDAVSYYTDDQGGYKISILISGAIVKNVTWDVIPLLRITGEVHSTYDAPFDPTELIGSISNDPVSTTAPADELKVKWTYPGLGATTLDNYPTDYDVEWAWIDEDAVANYKSGTTWLLEKIFAGNATRVTVPVSAESYQVPLLYDGKGWIFYRVRPVEQRLDGQVINGEWKMAGTEGNGAFHLTEGHEEGLNWQVSTTFAEDGKRKTVIQYFDGTLRGRQTVTKDNSQGNLTTVVAETYYDYQGRPTIQVLPSATLSNVIAFTKNFNNNDIDHIGYPKEIYDVLASGQPVCGNGAPPLDKALGIEGANGAGNYYSPQNPKVNESFHKFIPDAQGYPFTETRYTPDATGRIAAQGGVGRAFQLGTGHETKYFYTAAAQNELDILFGTDAGKASHYQKTYVQDANGQFSVSYTDMFGRTVATALAGDKPAGVEALQSLNELPVYASATDAPKQQLLDEETNVVNGRSIIMVKELMVTSAGPRHFEYKLDPKQLLLKNCAQQNICFDCLYDLTIEITNNCTNAVIYTTARKNFTLPHTSVCGTDPADIEVTFDLTFTDPGTYTITKKLTVSQEAQDQFRDLAMTMGNLVCKTKAQIREEIAEIFNAQNENCHPSCESCTEKLQGGEAAYRTKFMTQAGLTEAQMGPYNEAVKIAYAQAKAECDAICESGSDRVNNYEDIMLMDMSPDMGQYARILSDERDENGNSIPQVDLTVRPENIFYTLKYRSPKDKDGAPEPYKDVYGVPDATALSELINWSPQDFTDHFQDSWARQLLFYHPEYGKLKLVKSDNMRAAYHWQEQVQQKLLWYEVSATVAGSTPLPGSDPLFNTALPSSYTTQMSAKMAECVPIRKPDGSTYKAGMWQFAVAAVKCKYKIPADQFSCIEPTSNQLGNFPSEVSCDAEKNMVWRIFSSLYFSEREKIIYDYLQTAAPVNQSIFNVPSNPYYPRYQPRFINPGSMSDHVPADLATLYSEVTNPVSNSGTVMNATLQAQYENTCRAYAENWLEQLKVFDICKGQNIPEGNYTALINQLVSICKRGSDETHPLGSSSVPPGDTGPSPKTFEEALTGFMAANSVPYTATCHPYIINWPKPYENSPAVGNEELWETKPDECICTRLADLHTMHTTAVNNGTFTGTFASYLKNVHGTVISAADLAQLESFCAASTPPSCKFLTEPIMLPPALQCNASNTTCISCTEFGIYKSSFYTKFGAAIPSGLNLPVMFPANAEQENWNKAFAEYMNYKTGFSKQWYEYANFEKGCLFANDPSGEQTGICTRLTNYIATFNNIWTTLDDGVTECRDLFARYFNSQEGTNFSYLQIKFLYIRCNNLGCDDIELACQTTSSAPPDSLSEAVPCSEGFPTHLCGLNDPINPILEIEPDDPCDDINDMIFNATEETYILYLTRIKNDFDKAYLNKCLAVQDIESFTVQAPTEKEYHYTLYYYDQSGGLVQTVPPAGVDNFNNSISLRESFLASVKAARADPNSSPVRPYHLLPTVYRYNTLGQVVEQKSPDGGLSRFWYDELGRLVVSQNAKQANPANSPEGGGTKRYSYTLYDELGRLTQVGQKPTAAVMNQTVSRNKTSLDNFLNNGPAKEQITRTVYDVSYINGGTDLGTNLVQRNLRNRVSYSQVVATEPSTPSNPDSWAGVHSTATFYTYDIHGNVDVLLQDYNEGPMREVNSGANRYKKIAYTYDLISGKVNTVTYQPDYYDVSGNLKHHIDRFYHQYEYDAENKLTLVRTSHDGIIWEDDARYYYYKHGPLARTELGQQQVQGIDYAYTLQGWLKGVNSTAISAAPTEDCAPGTARDILDIFNRQQYNHPQNYVARQEINMFPEFTSDTPDDFETTLNASLAPCIPVIAHTPYITGDMGQDGSTPSGGGGGGVHQFVARDAYSFSLNYYQTTIGGNTVNDYQSINTTEQPFTNAGMFSLNNTDDPTPSVVARPLFNGNIASMFVNIPVLAPGGSASAALLYGYRYDQLNRIVSMDAFNGFNPTANGWYSGTPVAIKNYKEKVSYDANGNILSYLRNGDRAATFTTGDADMDNLYYQYPKYPNTPANIANRSAGKLMNNRLRFVQDEVDETRYTADIDNQTTLDRDFLKNNPASWQAETPGDDNYVYDEIGNLVKDVKEGINHIEWNVYGKIAYINKGGITIEYRYDASGNRIAKIVRPDRGIGTYTFYVRDASGNVMAVYEKNPPLPGDEGGDLKQTEVHLYGSSRLGIFRMDRNVENPVVNTQSVYTFERGNKLFELSNHLGNVLVTVSDRKLQVQDPANLTLITYYSSDVISATDYYPFGMDMVGRTFLSPEGGAGGGRYGFNGKERDKDINSLTAYDYGFRIYNPAIGKFLSVDPLTGSYPELTPYQFASNEPVGSIDLDGLESSKAFAGAAAAAAGRALQTQPKAGFDFSGWKLEKQNYTSYGSSRVVNIAMNSDKIGYNTGVNIWNGIVGTTEDATNIIASSEGRNRVFAEYKKSMTDIGMKWWEIQKRYHNGEVLEMIKEGADKLATPEGVESALTLASGFALGAVLGEVAGPIVSRVFNRGRFFSTVEKALCFVAGTKVLCRYGLLDIDKIEVNDSVWAFNEETGEIALKKVTALSRSKTDQLVQLLIGDEEIFTTPEHPFRINNIWVSAKEIHVGDSLTLFSNFKQIITGKRIIDTTVKVYNITVSEFHTYYVSKFMALVHNNCKFKWQKNKAMNDVLSKSIHGDVFNSKGIKVGEVGFELENGVITPKALGSNLNKKMKDYILKVGREQMAAEGFNAQLLNKVDEALNSGQIPISDRLTKLQEMQKILTPPPVQQ